jgi:hypothetical protein
LVQLQHSQGLAAQHVALELLQMEEAQPLGFIFRLELQCPQAVYLLWPMK